MAHAEREDEALERDPPPTLDSGKQIAHRGFPVAFMLPEPDLVVARGQREDIGRLFHPSLLEKELDLLFAQPVDIEGAARGKQFQVLDPLVGTGELAGAAGAGALLAGCGLLAHDGSMKRARALCRESILLLPAGLISDHINNLRDDVAGALDDDGVADADIAALAQLLAVAADALDVILIVQRDVLHDDAADPDRLELADRRERAGAADLDLDIPEHGDGALGGELVRDRPAWRARHEAETLLPIEAVHLVDDPVDIVIEVGALFLDLAMKRDQLLDRVTQPGQWVGREAAALEPADHSGLGIRRHLADLPPGVGEEAERTRGGDGGVLLAQRARRRIARIGEDGIAGGLLPLVKRQERLLGHVDLAAYLADVRHVAAFQFFRHVLQRTDIGGDVFAFGAVAARRGGDEFAGFVTQRHRQPVDLRLGAEGDLVIVAQFQKTPDTADEIDDVLVRKGIVERQHRHRVPDLGEAAGRSCTDFLRGRFTRNELGKPGLDGVDALAQRVVGGVRDGRRVLLIIALVVALDFERQPFQLDLGLRLGEGVDGGGSFCLCCLGHGYGYDEEQREKRRRCSSSPLPLAGEVDRRGRSGRGTSNKARAPSPTLPRKRRAIAYGVFYAVRTRTLFVSRDISTGRPCERRDPYGEDSRFGALAQRPLFTF